MYWLLYNIQGNRKPTSFTFYSEQVILPTSRSIGGKENMERDDTEKADVMLNILLNNPEEIQQKLKPSGIRINACFTLDMREISVKSAKADDNGAYISKGNTRTMHAVMDSMITTAHRSINKNWYVNIKESKGYYKKTVSEDCIFKLTRYYRSSKHNPEFKHTIATVRRYLEKDTKPYFLVIYKWIGDGERDFLMPRHGNATNPTTSAYFRKDEFLLSKVDNMLGKGLSTDKIYNNLTKQKTNTVSETITGPKLIDNRKYTAYRNSSAESKLTEAEVLISSFASNNLVENVIFTKDRYVSFNTLPQMINDLYRFCVLGNSILRIDTTFELVEGLWLTDTTYSHEGLITLDGKHPEFPGPNFWHFRKDRETYRRFAGELIIKKPELSGIKKVGHDLDHALSNGIGDILKEASKLWCTQHMQERDAHHLRTLGCNRRTLERVMADIYGSQTESMLQSGLADADDESDFDVKLQSLEDVWEDLAPGFHDWFLKRRAEYFKSCLILSARETLGIKGRFYTNGLELKHKLQKKQLKESDIPKKVSEVTSLIESWAEEFYHEETRAIRGMGKYRLACGYEHFLVDPVKWNRWGVPRQEQHLEAFRNFVPNSYNKYSKPKSAGLKATPQSKKRRADLPEAELFVDRLDEIPVKKTTVTPFKIAKADGSNWKVSYLYNSVEGNVC